MTDAYLFNTLVNIKELDRTIKKMQEDLDGLKDIVKEELANRAITELFVNGLTVRNTPITSERFDSKRFKADFGEEGYKEYCKSVTSTRFTIS